MNNCLHCFTWMQLLMHAITNPLFYGWHCGCLLLDMQIRFAKRYYLIRFNPGRILTLLRIQLGIVCVEHQFRKSISEYGGLFHKGIRRKAHFTVSRHSIMGSLGKFIFNKSTELKKSWALWAHCFYGGYSFLYCELTSWHQTSSRCISIR